MIGFLRFLLTWITGRQYALEHGAFKNCDVSASTNVVVPERNNSLLSYSEASGNTALHNANPKARSTIKEKTGFALRIAVR